MHHITCCIHYVHSDRFRSSEANRALVTSVKLKWFDPMSQLSWTQSPNREKLNKSAHISQGVHCRALKQCINLWPLKLVLSRNVVCLIGNLFTQWRRWVSFTTTFLNKEPTPLICLCSTPSVGRNVYVFHPLIQLSICLLTQGALTKTAGILILF